MANLKEVRNRIASVKSTQQITSAMKMVAASKLRKAQNAILQLRPYASKLQEILQNVASSLENTGDSLYSNKRQIEHVLLIPVTSNRGLCGAFNSNVIKATNEHIHKNYQSYLQKGQLYIITIGKYATDFYRKNKYPVVESFDPVFDDLSFENVSKITRLLMNDYTAGKYDRIDIIYNQFKNASVQKLVIEQFLPVETIGHQKDGGNIPVNDYIFEPSREQTVTEIIPKSLKIQFYKAILDSFASEQGARMTAMHQATDNATEILKELRLSYNKARQAAITKELLEIITGAEALKG
ncbi:MAG: ATP synthase F1 subunit gamma [Bacteroidetes bacterium]|nr:ATP synthase F1 subunit gamma [Bacteroidota bacterium]